MHQLGVHIKTMVTVSGEPIVLHDGDYKFEEQYQIPVGPVTLRAGDTITTECTYQNDTNQIVKFGESSDTEMCFSILFRYPRGKSPFCAGANEGGGTGGGGDGGTPIAKKPCAADDDPGNELGVGKLCSPAGGECGSNSGAQLCLGDFVKGEEFANFCTMVRTSDSECGAGAFCGHDSTRICIPSKCLTDGGS